MLVLLWNCVGIKAQNGSIKRVNLVTLSSVIKSYMYKHQRIHPRITKLPTIAIRALQQISQPIVGVMVPDSLWVTCFWRTSIQDYPAGVLCQESRQVSVFLYLIGNTELEQCYLCLICIVGGDIPAWHYLSAWYAIILAPIHKKFPPGLNASVSVPKYWPKLVFIWAFCSTGDLGNVEMSFFYLLCDQPLCVYYVWGWSCIYFFAF